MKRLYVGLQLIRVNWCNVREIDETHLILGREKGRVLYDCRTDKIMGITQAEENWDPKQEVKKVDSEKEGGLKKIISRFKPIKAEDLKEILAPPKPVEMGGLEKILANN
ncbi:MAG: hypothetical protein KKF50_05430 [Nanoarchaeota archaeon]|nr:hypothetical protein [Nanoarchaeota archaeon]